MNVLMKEKEIKLQILLSLARSQKALARIIEQIADVTEHTPQKSEILYQIEILNRYQLALANKISLIRIRHVKHGRPRRPWMNEKQTQGRLASCLMPRTIENVEQDPVKG